ncbi:MAG: hypothetical protein QM695_09265 [Micropruina sp.]
MCTTGFSSLGWSAGVVVELVETGPGFDKPNQRVGGFDKPNQRVGGFGKLNQRA